MELKVSNLWMVRQLLLRKQDLQHLKWSLLRLCKYLTAILTSKVQSRNHKVMLQLPKMVKWSIPMQSI
jgi:hypothetical protein